METEIDRLMALRDEENKAASQYREAQNKIERIRENIKEILSGLRRESKLANESLAIAIPSMPGKICIITPDCYAEQVVTIR